LHMIDDAFKVGVFVVYIVVVDSAKSGYFSIVKEVVVHYRNSIFHLTFPNIEKENRR